MTKPTPMYVCTDMIVFNRQEGRVLLIRRKNEPFKGLLALPGGFVDPTETAEAAAERELYEETSLLLLNSEFRFFHEYSYPDRDPRGRVISLVFYVLIDACLHVKARDDADKVGWYEFESIPERELAFDHHSILSDFMTEIAYA